MIRLAVIDVDSGFLSVLGKRADAAGWEHWVAGRPLAIDALVRMRANALVVNLAVLGPAGWEYLEQVCARLPGLAVLVCTGQSSVAQRVRGLRLGADDWVTKPCHAEELLARVEAAVRARRRAEAPAEAPPTVAGELEIRGLQAFVHEQPVDLTRRELELLTLLAEASGQVLPREDIYQRVWGYAMAHGDRSVDVFVRKLRQKLERVSPRWRYIHTHFGVGYRFSAERVDGEGSDGPAPEPEPEPDSLAAAAPAPAAAPPARAAVPA